MILFQVSADWTNYRIQDPTSLAKSASRGVTVVGIWHSSSPHSTVTSVPETGLDGRGFSALVGVSVSDLDQALANRHPELTICSKYWARLVLIRQPTGWISEKHGTWIPIPLGAKVIIEVRLMDLFLYRPDSRRGAQTGAGWNSDMDW